FYKLSPSTSGHKVTMNDAEGNPIASATANFWTSHGAVFVNIWDGVGYLDFNEPGEYNFNYLQMTDKHDIPLDIFHPFTIDANGQASSLDLIAHLSNVTGQVTGESKSVFGNLSICKVDSDGTQQNCFIQEAPGGRYAMYLPDGDYIWES